MILAHYNFGPQMEYQFKIMEVESATEDEVYLYEIVDGHGHILTNHGACIDFPTREDVLRLLEGKPANCGGGVGPEHRRPDMRKHEGSWR